MMHNDWQDTIAMAASAIEDLLETADEHAGCWADVPARLRALTAPPAPAVPDELIDQVCHAAAGIYRQSDDDKAQAIIDSIRVMLAAPKGGK